MSETTPETEPIDAEAAYQDPRSVPLSEAWTLIDPGLAHQDRLPATKAHLRDQTLAIFAFPWPPRLGDKPAWVPGDLVLRALDHPCIDLALPADELMTGNSRHGGLEFIRCRTIRVESLSVGQAAAVPIDEPLAGKGTITLEDLFRGLHKLAILPERWRKTRDEFLVEFGPEPGPANEERLKDVLVELFLENETLETAPVENLAEFVVERDFAFWPNRGRRKHGRWREETLHHRISLLVVEAREAAAELRDEGVPDSYY